MNFYLSNKVYQRNAKQFRNGILQTRYYSYENQLQISKDVDSKYTEQRKYKSMIGSVRTNVEISKI
jgi:hypothetical protein